MKYTLQDMKQKIFVSLLFLLGILLQSCQQDSISEPSILEISPKGVLSLDSGTSKHEVSVSTNQSSWDFVKTADWVTATKDGNKLIIDVQANSTTQARTSEIIIIAGDSRDKIIIDQNGVNVSISTSTQVIETNQWGGDFTIDVESNLEDWVVECNDTWITATPIYTMSELRISVAEHKEREDRVGKIHLLSKDGRGLYEVTIKQNGTLYYVMPYLGFIETSEAVREFEINRRSETITVPDGVFNLYQWVYKTKSPVFSLVTYLTFNNRYKSSKVFCTDGAFFQNKLNLEGQKTYLLKQGFEQKSDLVFEHPELNVRAEINKDAASPHVAFTYEPKQPGSMPTMDKFPYRYFTFSKGDLANIEAWENANGGTLNPDRSEIDVVGTERNLYWFDVNKDPVLATVYNVATTGKHTVSAAFIILSNRDQVYFTHKSSLFLTQEFRQLMKKEGFTYLGDIGPGHRFIHLDHFLDVLVSYVSYEGIDEPKVQIHVTPLE